MTKEAFNIQRVQCNLEAIKALQGKTPNPEILKQYTGWGGLRDAIYTTDIYRTLKKTLSEKAITSIKKTLTSAYYTPPALIQFIYDALALLDKPFKTILEPSAGHGLFFEWMPASLKKEKCFAVELDEVSCQLFSYLYPEVQLHQGGFEYYQPQMTFDLIIGNPPYGRGMVMDECHTDLASLRIHHYFVAKCMRLLAPGGILAMVLPRYFLDNRRDHARTIISQEGGSLLAAYRLPDNLFADAKVTVDVVFIIKEQGSSEWLDVDKIRLGNETGFINHYFSLNPSHVLGGLRMVEAYGRPELTCHQKSSNTISLLKQQLAYFPPQQLPTFEECKFSLRQRIEMIDTQIEELAGKKKRLMQSQRELQLIERQFVRQCMEQMNCTALA